MQLLWIVNSGSIGDTHTSTRSYNRSGAASQAKGMFWLFTALKYVKDDFISRENLECSFRRAKVVFEFMRQMSGNGALKMRLRLKQHTQYQ